MSPRVTRTSLGRDFWRFRVGQFVSLLGDGCGSVALSWWILSKTGSASAMSSVLAPAMAVRLALLPLLGPLADALPRKRLIALADFWRFATTAVLALLVHRDRYSAPAVIALYMMTAAGSALFEAASSGIVPQLVGREELPEAVQKTYAADSFARIAGGIVGGVIVSVAGVLGAFVLDAISYAAAGVASVGIQASTAPERGIELSASWEHWRDELGAGFKVLYRIPVLFWLGVLAMFMNLMLSPLALLLAVLAKEARGMPAWFLGGLSSSVGAGAVVGALSVGRILPNVRPHRLVVTAIAMVGFGMAVLPWTPNVLLPFAVMFGVGMGQTWANVPMNSQISLAVPDSHRARVGSIIGFLCGGMAPLGIAAAGLLVSGLGLTSTMAFLGVALAMLAPLVLLVPAFPEFMATSPSDAAVFFDRRYPGVFARPEGRS